ncbi:MAG: hypothetical protein FWG04_05450 [Desulfovibrionaceae bacterium]|nr:hypothetical protein [Desulfovibrionaceae bacterium]
MKKTTLIIIGGFLGAGKTTLLWETARRLESCGERPGLITNDQASGLVDTAHLSRGGNAVVEVSGSCFCCNFNGFMEAVDHLRQKAGASPILAEPVGSCTDISATILQPVKMDLANNLRLAPFSVLIDPQRLDSLLLGGTAGLHPSAAYILIKQLEEADIIVISKADLLTTGQRLDLTAGVRERWPNASVHAVSAVSGQGLDAWLAEVQKDSGAGAYVTDVDYDIYAEGEAVLGWLNGTYLLTGWDVNWDALGRTLLAALGGGFAREGLAVGHVKLFLQTPSGFLLGNLTGGLGVQGETRGSAGRGGQAELIVNARVETTPVRLRQSVEQALRAVCGDAVRLETIGSNCLSPGRPHPTYRVDRVIEAVSQ